MYSHHFIVSGVDAFHNEILLSFIRQLVEIHTDRDAWGNLHSKAVRVYAVKSKVDHSYRLHINLFESFKQHMSDKGVVLKNITYHPLYTPEHANIEMKKGWEPFEEQKAVIEYIVQDGIKKVIDAQTGQGKELCNGTPVKTPGGWTNIEDLNVGDLVMGETGAYHRVTGVFPQGRKDLYKFTFRDGRTALAGAEHLWAIHYRGRYSIHTTQYLLNNKPVEGKRYAIPLVKRWNGNFSSAMFKPWLGDSYRSYNGNFIHKTKDYKEALELQEFCWIKGSLCTITEEHGYYIVDTGFYIYFNQCVTTDFKLDIISIEKLDYQEECTCIAVDNPTKLFVIKNYIVTHNTVMTMFGLAQIKQRVAMVIKPMYIERWLDVIVGDGTVLQHTTKKDVVVVRGGKQLRGLIYMAQEGKLNAQFIVISNTTLSLYYKHYKEFGASEEYGWVHPEDFWKLLGVGVRVIDEAHEHFYVCFITDLNSHVHKSVELSATLEPDNPFLRRMYNIMYPKHLRMNTGAYKRYIEVYGLTYHILDDPKYIQTSNRGRSTYSQAAYETNIFKQKPRMVRLRKMMLGLTERLFMSERLPEHKLLIFFETIDMCTDIASVLKDAYPHLKVSRYTEEEDASVLDTHDIIVATPKSAGTAVDIKKLQIVISFVMRNSTQAVEQMIGRLRQLKTDKLQPKFYYLFTRQIDTHVRYHHKKQEIMKFKALSLDEQISGYEI